MEHTETSELFSYQLSPQIQEHLSETARWGKFLAIVGFIMCGIMSVAGIGLQIMFSRAPVSMVNAFPMAAMGGTFSFLIYIILAVLYFFPCFFLYRFSTKAKRALYGTSQEELENAFRNLKSLFKYMGVLTVIFLAFYGLVFIIAILGNAM